MLTDRGWAALGAGFALVVLWVVLGEPELIAAAVLLVTASLGAWVYTRLTWPRVTVSRRIAPESVHEGGQATVQTRIDNANRLSVRSVTVVEDVAGLGSAAFVADRIRPRESVTAGYQILCRPRGLYQVGPSNVKVTDPFRLAEAGGPMGETDTLVVLPRVEDLSGFPIVPGRDPIQHASRPEFSYRGGEDFYAIREYQIGDDLRRVHWPTSAKRDELMIRQLETPWQSRAAVFFDLRPSPYRHAADFEMAVVGAASMIRHLYRSGFDADLWVGGRRASSEDPNRYRLAMEALAAVQPEPSFDLQAQATRLIESQTGGALILVTGNPDDELLGAQRMLSSEHRATILLAVTERSADISYERDGIEVVVAAPDGSWKEAWVQTVGRAWSTD